MKKINKKSAKKILDIISTPAEKLLDKIENGEVSKEEAKKAYDALSTPEEKVADFLENYETLKNDLNAKIREWEAKTNETTSSLKETQGEAIKAINNEVKQAISSIPTPKDGYSPKKNIDYFDGKNGNEITSDDIIEKMSKIENGAGFSILKLKDLEWLKTLPEGMNWSSAGFKVYTDASLTGDGSFSNPLSVLGSESGYLTKALADTYYYPLSANPAGYLTSLSGAWLLNGNTNGVKKTLGSIDNYDIGFLTNNTERMTILAAGNVGIGTTAPNELLSVAGNIGIGSDSSSYLWSGGSGDRTTFMTVTSNLSVSGALSKLVNGSLSQTAFWFNGEAVNGTKYLKFDFGSAKVVNEMKFYQDGTASNQGVWQFQGSNDNSNWTSIGTTFTLGGVATETITTMSANTTAYRYYQLLGVSGTTSSAPYVFQFTFQILGHFTLDTAGNITTLGNFATMGQALFGVPGSTSRMDVRDAGLVPYDGYVAQIHQDNQDVFALGIFNDQYSAITPAFAYYAQGDGSIKMGTSVAVPMYFYTNSYGNIRMTILGSGNVGIGTTSPTAALHLRAGVAGAGGAPLKLTAGTLLTTPELGTLEYVDDGTTGHLYFTLKIATVTTRVLII